MLQFVLGFSQRRCPIHPRCQCKSTGILQTGYAWWSLLGGDMNQNSLAVRLKPCSYLRLRQVMKCYRFTVGKPKESCWKTSVAYDLYFYPLVDWLLARRWWISQKRASPIAGNYLLPGKLTFSFWKNDGWKSWKAILSFWTDPFSGDMLVFMVGFWPLTRGVSRIFHMCSVCKMDGGTR